MKLRQMTMAVLFLAGCSKATSPMGKAPDQSQDQTGKPETLLPDSVGPAPALNKGNFEADSFESLIEHVAPGFVSETLSYEELAEKWQQVLAFEEIDLTYLRFPNQGIFSGEKKSVAGHTCADTLFMEGKQIESRHFNSMLTMSGAVKTLQKEKKSLSSLEKVTVLPESPSFATISYQHNKEYSSIPNPNTYITQTLAYTTHIGVSGSRFLEAYEFVDTSFKDLGETVHLKVTTRCVRIIEPEIAFERSSCSQFQQPGPGEFSDDFRARDARMIELSKKEGEHSAKDWQGQYLESAGVSKQSTEVTQTGSDTAHFNHDFRRINRGAVMRYDGLVNPHYDTAEGDLTFTFGKEDSPFKRHVVDCQVQTFNMQR